jgi:Zn-dependent protease with chaperone function
LSLVLALRVEWPRPDGIVIDEAEAPGLHQSVDALRSATKGPRIHEVRITGEMNAAIAQYPRLLFLPSRNILFLGLPLLQALAPEEVEAVIAHEMGHFAGAHGRTASFIYHIRMRWSQLGERFSRGIVAGGLRRFFRWYGPWFAAYSFVLARRQEYEADALAARIVGSATMGNALIRIAYQSARWHEGWSLIWTQAVERPDPPSSPYRLLGEVAFAAPDETASEVLARSLTRQRNLDDTHPSLSQRLAALDVVPQLPPPFEEPAAAVLLGTALTTIVDRLDAEWHNTADESWAEEFGGRQSLQAERQALEDRAGVEGLDYEGQHRLAQLVEVIDGPQQGADAFATVLERFPDAYGSRFRHGDALLDAGDEAGVASLLEAARGEPGLLTAALERIVRYGYATGREQLIETFESQLDTAIAAEQEARRTSSAIDESTVLRALEAEKQEELIQLTASVAGVKWLLAGMRDLPNGQQIVFVFATQRSSTGTEVLDALIDAMLPAGDLIGIQHCNKRRWLTKRLRHFTTCVIRA